MLTIGDNMGSWLSPVLRYSYLGRKAIIMRDLEATMYGLFVSKYLSLFLWLVWHLPCSFYHDLAPIMNPFPTFSFAMTGARNVP